MGIRFEVYKDAVKVMKSEDLDAFDLSKESNETHAAYGDGTFAQGCMLARRLMEHGVKFVEVTLGGWDMHQDIYARLPERAADLDRALGTLLADLDRCGLLDDTLVVLTSEFGCTPKIKTTVATTTRKPSAPSSGAAASLAVSSMARPTRASKSPKTKSASPTSMPPSPTPSACRLIWCSTAARSARSQ